MPDRRLPLATLLLPASAASASAQALVHDLAGFKAIPVPPAVECKDSLGERQCAFSQTVNGKEYTFPAAFLEQGAGDGSLRRAYVIGVSPPAAARLARIIGLYAHYAARLALHEQEALITVVPSLDALPARCAGSPSARKTDGVCHLTAGESLVRTATGDTDQPGIVFARQWVAK